ncbi:MAG: alginate export family protein [Gammaproteobacteria bacterium]
MKNRITHIVLLLFTLGWLPVQASEKLWNIHDTANLPGWIKFSVTHRTRYETIDDTFKKNNDGGDQVLAFRTNAFLEASYQQFRFGAEFIDSRIDLEDAGTPVNTTMVNETELLQAYIAWQTHNFLDSGLDAELKFGRQTMDIGSRRLVARNRFRNTINNFNGINFSVQEQNQWQWRNFVVLPVSRLPNDQLSLRTGTIEFDEENFNVIFAGSFFSISGLPLQSIGELYFFQLSEDDFTSTASKNRNLSTPGFRWYRNPQSNQFDFELESAIQTGTSHASASSTDTAKLDHFAYFGHVAFGYTFDIPWSPRLLLQYDYASGDSDPSDGKNGRFETLYGARRFEYGPTSTWGAFARANINTPGIRVEFKPLPNLAGFVAHRAFWLAEKRDSWTGAGLRDTTGQSGSYIGQQVEARLKWEAVPKLVTVETGWAHIFKGEFAKKAPGSPGHKSDSDYFYAQTTFTF